MRPNVGQMGLIAAITTAIAVAIAGCGSGPGATTGPGSTAAGPTSGSTAAASAGAATDAPPTAGAGEPVLRDPCTLVTQEEAAAAVAAPVAGGVEEQGIGTPDLGSGRVCSFTGTGDGELRVETFADPGDLWATYKLQQSQFGNVTDLALPVGKGITVGNSECDIVANGTLMRLTFSPGDKYATDPEPRLHVVCQVAGARLAAPQP
jgi:hypothetical protein